MGTMKNLELLGVEAAKRHLRRRGCQVLDTVHDEEMGVFSIIAEEDGEIVMAPVKTLINIGVGFDRHGETFERGWYETAMAQYLADHPELVGIDIRFDRIDLLVTNTERAMLRHHVNAIN